MNEAASSAPPAGSVASAERSVVTLLIAALGGEGGGVLSNWVVDAATAEGFWVQATSVPGVAQRTGATTYYIEIGPHRDRAAQPPMALLPSPGNVDLVVATELLEAGRAAQNGFVTPERTTVVASTHRFFAVVEKSAMTDGRFETDRILEVIRTMSKSHLLDDLTKRAADAQTVLSSVLLGVIAATGITPMPRAAFEDAIRRSGIAVEANLRGFTAGTDLVENRPAGSGEAAEAPAAEALPASGDGLDLSTFSQLDPAVREIVALGAQRQIEYQSRAYAARYLERLAEVKSVDEASDSGAGYRLTGEVARQLALWMAFEDIIRVAALKTKPDRYQRVRDEVRARPGQPVVIREFLKPGVEELCSILPAWLARPVLGLTERRNLTSKLNLGMHVKTTSVTGFSSLWLLARLRVWRPFSYRFKTEQQAIDRWLALVVQHARCDYELGLEVARCAGLVKGYGDTHSRGTSNFERIMACLDRCAATGEPAATLRRLREAASADPDGAAFKSAIAELEA